MMTFKRTGLSRFMMICAMLCALLMSVGCMQQIPPASVGILFSARTGVSESIMQPQVVYVGWRQKLFVYPTSTKNATYVRAKGEGEQGDGDDSILATTLEGAQLPVDVTVAWHVDPANMTTVFKEFGEVSLDDIQHNFIRYITQYGVNAVSGQRSIFDLTAKERKDFGPLVKAQIEPILNAYGISVSDVYIGEVYPPDEISKKIQEKIGKLSELEQTKIQLQRTVVEAKTQITNAQRDAAIAGIRSAQGDMAIALRRLEIKKKAVMGWDGLPPLIGGRNIPFTDIDLR
jgi:regulator of protease activity HflC (stomatin/prohibitin superfamily)